VVHAAVETGATKRMPARRRHRLPKESTAQSALEIRRRHDAFAQRVLEQTDDGSSSSSGCGGSRGRGRRWKMTRLCFTTAVAAGSLHQHHPMILGQQSIRHLFDDDLGHLLLLLLLLSHAAVLLLLVVISFFDATWLPLSSNSSRRRISSHRRQWRATPQCSSQFSSSSSTPYSNSGAVIAAAATATAGR